MIRLWGRETSSNVQCVRWALEELGLAYERIDVGENFGGLDTPEYLAKNPMGKIPVIEDGDMVLFESAAILRYLARTYGDDGFWPADPARRSRADMWAEWAKHEIAELFTLPIFWRVVRTPVDRQDPTAIAQSVEAFEASLAVANDRLATRTWLAGDAMTPGDFHLGHVLFRYFDTGVAARDLPHLRAYYDRLTSRPAYQRAVMVPYDILRDTI